MARRFSGAPKSVKGSFLNSVMIHDDTLSTASRRRRKRQSRMTSPSRVERIAFSSDVLKGNPCGDPHVRTVPVYLPPGYDDGGDERYPVVFCLTGFTGRGTMLLNEDGWAPNIAQRMDRLIE